MSNERFILKSFLLLFATICGTKSADPPDSKSHPIPFESCEDSHNRGCKNAIDNDPKTCYVSADLLPDVTKTGERVWWEGDMGKPASVEKVEFSHSKHLVSIILDLLRTYKVSLDNDYVCSDLGGTDSTNSFKCDNKITRKVKISPQFKSYMQLCEVTAEGRHVSTEPKDCLNSGIYIRDKASGKCYLKFSSHRMIHSTAKETCEVQGGRVHVDRSHEKDGHVICEEVKKIEQKEGPSVNTNKTVKACKNPHLYTLDPASRKCFSKPSDNMMNYDKAKAMCEEQGGRLPILKLDEDITYFESRVPDVKDDKRYKGYWLGGSRVGNDFVWDGETKPMGKTNWQTDEPSSHDYEDRLHTIANPKFKHVKGKWNNVRATAENYVICQEVKKLQYGLDVVINDCSDGSEWKSDCGFATDEDESTCFEQDEGAENYLTRAKTAWWHADFFAKVKVWEVTFSHNNHLVSSGIDLLRGYNVTLDNGKQCKLDTSIPYGSNFTYLCGNITSTGVRIEPLWKSYLLLCEVKVRGYYTGGYRKCPLGFTFDLLSQRCYSRAAGVIMSYAKAKRWCKGRDGKLPVIENEEDVSYFEKRAPKYPMQVKSLWIGYWLALRQQPDGRFVWEETNKTVTTEKWSHTDPNLGRHASVGVQIARKPKDPSRNGKWYDFYKAWDGLVICQA